jgi:hypothetical protein
MKDLETRVAMVERDVHELRELRGLIHVMDKKLDVLAARKECPDPNRCLALEPRLASLEATRNKFLGAMVVCTGLGTVAGGLVAALLQRVLNS